MEKIKETDEKKRGGIDNTFKINPGRFDPTESFLNRNMDYGAFVSMENLHDGWIFLGFTEATGPLLGTGKYVALYENANGSRVWKHCDEERLSKLIEKTKNKI